MPKPTHQQIADALHATCGHVFLAAEKLGCDPATIEDRVARSPRLAAIVASSRGRMVDTAEAVLYRAIIERESWAVRFALTALGKERGYSSQEETAKSGAQKLLEKRRTIDVSQLLEKVLRNKDFLDFCRSRHRVDPLLESRNDPDVSPPNGTDESPR